METLYSAFYNIDVENKKCESRDISSPTPIFIEDLYKNVVQNKNKKSYVIRDLFTLVIRNLKDIFAMIDTNNSFEIKELADGIARKLLREEIESQNQINNFKIKLKRGSLIISLHKLSNNYYAFILAKVEHSQWVDSEKLLEKNGFSVDKKSLWKFAVIYFNNIEDFIVDKIYVYTDNGSKYWANRFLELDEESDDDKNTKKVYDAVNSVLLVKVKRVSVRNYYEIRNYLIVSLKTEGQFNYFAFVDEIMKYQFDDAVNRDALEKKLRELPEKKHFDTQFNTSPKAIQARLKKNFDLTTDIKLYIDGPIDFSKIESITDNQGKEYIKVLCEDHKTYETFKK